MTAATTAVALYDDAMLDELAGMGSATDMVGSSSLDILKVNYDEDSVYPRGEWVVGQKKKDNVITEQGELVTKIVILTARFRRSYYHEATGEYHNTMMFEANSQPPNMAEVTAKVAALGGELKFQIVIIGLAVVESGFKVFVANQGGVAYKPLMGHLNDLSTLITPTRKITPFPMFAHLTILGETKKDKKGTITFYTPSFIKGPVMTREQCQIFKAEREKAYIYVEMENARMAERSKTGVGSPAAPPAAAPPAAHTPPPAYVPPTPPPAYRTDAEVAGMKSAGPGVGEDVPFKMEDVEGPGGDVEDAYDIEAAMASIMGKK